MTFPKIVTAAYIVAIVFLFPRPTQCQEADQLTLSSLLEMTINTASKYAQKVSEAPSSVSIVTSQDIENYGYETLADVFASVKGFYTSYDRNYSYAGVRGFSRPTDYNNRILLQINGFTVNENVFGSAMIDTSMPLNPEVIDRVEIIRGPGSALYGTNAMFAVVNIVTKSGKKVNGAGLTPEMGSYGRKRASGMFGVETESGIDIMVSGVVGDIEGDDHYYKEYDNPPSHNGMARGIDGDRYHNIISTVRAGNVEFFGMQSVRTKDVPTGSWETDFNNSLNNTLDRNLSLGVLWDKYLSNRQQLRFRSYYSRYKYKAGYPYLEKPDVESVYFDSALGITYGGELQYTLDTGPHNRFIAGVEYRNNPKTHYKYWDSETVMYDDDSPFDIVSGYIQDTYQLRSDLSVTAGLRFDEYSSFGGKVSPRAAVIYNPYFTTTLKLIHGTAFRVPNVYETNYEEADYWKKNDDIKKEEISTTELIWEQRLSNHLMSSISGYVYTMNDMIDIVYDNADNLLYYDNISKITAHGVEMGIDARLDQSTHFYANYSYQEASDYDTETRLTNSPANLVKCGIAGPLVKSIIAAGDIRYESVRKTVYGTRTDAYILTNLKLSTKTIRDHVKFSFMVRNVFDVAYGNPGGFEHLQDCIRQDGRNYIFKVHLYY